jgi:hypothetical protein
MVDFRQTTFENCSFNGVTFKHCDMQGRCLDGQTFIGVKFENEATFKGATLKNVSFVAPLYFSKKKNCRVIKGISLCPIRARRIPSKPTTLNCATLLPAYAVVRTISRVLFMPCAPFVSCLFLEAAPDLQASLSSLPF